jgi:hypothetical protein
LRTSQHLRHLAWSIRPTITTTAIIIIAGGGGAIITGAGGGDEGAAALILGAAASVLAMQGRMAALDYLQSLTWNVEGALASAL